MTAPGRPSASRRPREERIAQIMAAAGAEFRRAGFERASMARIARQAGVVEGTIYRFFENKRDLLGRVIEAWYVDMLADYARELAGVSGTRARLRYMIWRHLRTLRDEPAMCRMMFERIRADPDYRASAVFRQNHLYTVRTLDIVREGIARGEIRPDIDLRLARDLIYGGVEHRSWAWLRGEGEIDPDGAADAIVDLVLGGLAADDAPAGSGPGAAQGGAAPGLERKLGELATRLERVAADRKTTGEDP